MTFKQMISEVGLWVSILTAVMALIKLFFWREMPLMVMATPAILSAFIIFLGFLFIMATEFGYWARDKINKFRNK